MKKLAFTLFAALPMMGFSTLAAHDHHHKDKDFHDRFNIPLPEDTLTATVDITGIFTAPAGSTVTPFVATPDGLVQEGVPTLISALPAVLTFPTVYPVVAGSYTYGVLVNGSGIVVSAQTLPVIISSTSTGIATTTNIFFPYVTLPTSAAQFNTTFVYNPPVLP